MTRLPIRVGSVLFYKTWFWVVDRRINNSWRLRALKTGRFICLPQWELWESCQNGQCKLLAAMGDTKIESMDTTLLRQLARQLMTMPEDRS